MADNKGEIKRCPVCGGEGMPNARVPKYDNPFQYRCAECRYRTHWYKTIKLALHYWNSRELTMAEMLEGIFKQGYQLAITPIGSDFSAISMRLLSPTGKQVLAIGEKRGLLKEAVRKAWEEVGK